MALRKHNLSATEITRAFAGAWGIQDGPLLSPQQLADATGVSVKTIYHWIAQGRLSGAVRKRGKHCLIWRDRAIDILFNGKEWT